MSQPLQWKPLAAILAVPALALLLFGGWWALVQHEYADALRETARPFQEACQTEEGCPPAPAGWERTKVVKGMAVYERSQNGARLSYAATPGRFSIRWTFTVSGQEVRMTANGGRELPLTIRKPAWWDTPSTD